MARSKRQTAERLGEIFRKGAARDDRAARMERIRWREDGLHIIEFGRIYFPSIFKAESPEFHAELVSAMSSHSRTAIAAPRGHAKSMITTFATPLYDAVTAGRNDLVPEGHQSDFDLLLLASQPLADQALWDIKEELESNELLREDFGDLIGRGKWTQSVLDCSNGVRLAARGIDGAMRGVRKGGLRPKKIIGDDLDGDDAAESRIQCAKIKRRWYRVVSNLFGAEGGWIFVVGTILHWDALLGELLRNSAYWSKIYRAELEWDEAGRPTKTLWGGWWTPEKLIAKRAEIGSAAYESEFMNNPVDPETQTFKPEAIEAILYDNEVDPSWPARGAADLAISQKKTADWFVLLICRRSPDGRLWIDDGVRARLDFAGQVNTIFEVMARHQCHMIGIESVAYQQALAQTVAELSRKAGWYLSVQELRQSVGKEWRINSLVPLIENGTIRIARRLKWLWEALLVYPSGEHDDEADCAEMAVRMWKQGGDRKTPRFSGFGMIGRDYRREP